MKGNSVVKKELEIYRKKIDEIDNQIIKLLNSRGDIAKKIGNLKKQGDMDVSQPNREKEIIKRMKNESILLKNGSIEAIWKEIINACKDIQTM
jgi:chorismate mutase/prephenate dehydratase